MNILTQDLTHLKKAAAFTDVHFGKKGNSEQHNQDCLDFVTWFCGEVKKDPSIDHIVICGDWHEHRSALNILTMDYSYRAATLLSELNLPIFLLVGNHDLFHRQVRTVFSTVMFSHLPNFTIINEPVVVKMAAGDVLLAPFLFHEEYPTLSKFNKVPVWWGHFEFKGFVISGYNVKMPNGPDHMDFKGPKKIFSGHFHKRQVEDNIVYIGNTFPMDFSDAGDNQRGMAIYDYKKDSLSFIDWADCPKYIKVKLSKIVKDDYELPTNARVKCIVDVAISYEESLAVKEQFSTDFNLREFNLEETDELNDVLENTSAEMELSSDEDGDNLDGMVVQMLANIDTDKIDNNLLVSIYKNIKVDQ